ncbi:unnamed protein product [Onchocerca flexuosa]|uniref:Uncharacterized protein n=1 Tax=Onchocerca flexuosa TaxID=387005 RepID=A0A183HJY9_9BILA|nr:unnamed protein product [Onchocerca flexuosa]
MEIKGTEGTGEGVVGQMSSDQHCATNIIG